MKEFTVTLDELTEIVHIMADNYSCEVTEDAIRTDYSGRGMYGRRCVGFVIDTSDTLALGAAIATFVAKHVEDDLHMDHAFEIETLIRRATTDNMGFQIIIYFPGVTLAVEDVETAEAAEKTGE